MLLGAGDAFHLVPRALAFCTTGLEHLTVPLGMGKFITSITMTVFYIILYDVRRVRYQVRGRNEITAAGVPRRSPDRALLLPPERMAQRQCTSPGDLPEHPLCAAGPSRLHRSVLKSARETKDAAFRNMWLTIVLSFAFYIPVVLWADAIPMIGMLMIPKTCAYVGLF